MIENAMDMHLTYGRKKSMRKIRRKKKKKGGICLSNKKPLPFPGSGNSYLVSYWNPISLLSPFSTHDGFSI